jgi:hypothetical protein
MPFDLMDMNLPPEDCAIYVFRIEDPEDGGSRLIGSVITCFSDYT